VVVKTINNALKKRKSVKLNQTMTLMCFVLFFVGTAMGGELRTQQKRMLAWEAQMEAFQSALYRHDFKKMVGAMAVIENSGPVNPKVLEALEAGMEDRDFGDYKKLDRYIHGAAGLVIEEASEGNIQKLLVHQGRMLMACIQCHDQFLAKAVNAVQHNR